MKTFKTYLQTNKNIVSESLKQYSRKSRHAVVSFGDFSEKNEKDSKLSKAVIQHANQVEGDPHIFVSNTTSEESPLSAKEKIALLKVNNPEIKRTFHAATEESPSIYHFLSDLHKKGYNHASIILPDDSDPKLRQSLHQFNGMFDTNGNGYNFKSLNILHKHEVNPSSGERPPKIEDMEDSNLDKISPEEISPKNKGE